ncbi:protein translocase subunit SecD [Fluviispira multicolorata]|uniref:Protein translocase subunit SecD n=1 Tax=Fluviispira multicolorata TaxID=2654512 RepID=A0A833JGD0_9BACT|nr:protein translocase subunit SecD [Fluviispira multicolorata]KAB8032026.1 protein translocase subunit SecD [Fluviispira multicolorata]
MQNKSSMPPMWWTKSVIILCALVFGIIYTLPTFLGNPSDWQRDSKGVPTQWYERVAENLLPNSRINLGLDLKGGLSLTLNVEVEKAIQDSIHRSITLAKDLVSTEGIKITSFKVNPDFSATVELEDANKAQQVQKRIQEQTLLVLFDKIVDKTLYFQVNRSYISDYEKQLMQQAINTIRNRIDQFGVAEPNIFQAGSTRIMVELPGMSDTQRAKELLGNTAQLDFRLVLNSIPQAQLPTLLNEARQALKITNDDNQPATIETLSQWLRDKNKLPKNTTIILHRVTSPSAQSIKTISTLPYLVESHAKLTGDLIEDAQAQQSTENYIPQYVVSLKFKPQGAKLFGDITTQAFQPNNAPHQVAIILDGNVQSAPVVNAPITTGSAQITMGSSTNLVDQMKQAQDLSLVLRAGALPASVKVVEERQIGPSEGAQNIHAGFVSTIIAGVLVVVVMLIIYGMSGFVANIAMLFNVLLILAFMALFGATLTLPGIAGIVLTMAIAVDGNVVINERIREEIRSGFSQKQAFYKGYNTSFRTLIDAHITSAVAGIVLIIYGNPTVKGFAVTLLCGIICTLFTSYYVTEVIGQWLVEKTKVKRFG